MAEAPIEIDGHADLMLRVGQPGDGQTIFNASSRALARASPVFDKMMYGDFAESRSKDNGNCWTVDLPTDSPSAVEILLNITHARFQLVPRAPSIAELYDLTILTDFYDAAASLAPWADAWMSTIHELPEDAGLAPKLLWVSWQLGRAGLFTIIAWEMLMESDGPLYANTGVFKDLRTPPDIVERINAIRAQTIQALLDIISDMIEALIVVDERPRWCHHATWMGHHRCESMILGSLTFCIARAGLWPLPDPHETNLSVRSLYGRLTGLIIHDIGKEDTKALTVDHKGCNPVPHLLEQIERVMKEIPSPVTDLDVRRLEEQANKLSL